jgi:NAD(P)-dependent dehydrogenase (short-subunit alcohol dehydrogenase family)
MADVPPDPGLGTVLVTGAASGLGAAVAAAVRDGGGRAVALDRVPVEGYEHEVVDLSDTRAAERAVTTLVERTGGTLDAVVTAAGTDKCGALADVAGDDWDRVVLVNLLGTAAVVRAALPHLRRSSNPRVVTVASTLGHRVFPDATAYCASKFGVVGFTRALQTELKGEVHVTLLTPGGMHTAFFDDRDEQYKPPADAKLNRPEDVAMNVLHVLRQPSGCEVKELVVASAWEGSWP